MYSYEERILAVQLYIELGKRTAATILSLGYPTKNALKSWYREYERSRDLPKGYVRWRSKYTDEQKKTAVEYYLSHGRCLATTRRALGYPRPGTLAAWVCELYPEARRQVVGSAVRRPPYSDGQKQEAIVALCTRQESAKAVARRFGVSRPTLYNWKNQFLGREAPASMKRRKKGSPSLSEKEKLQEEIASLRSELRRLQLEHDLLQKAGELLKKGLGVDLQLLENREKTLLVEALKSQYPLAEICICLDLARSSYFYHRARLQMGDKYAGIRHKIREVFEQNYQCFGYRRIRAFLARERIALSEKVVQRLMRQEQLIVATKRRRYHSYLGEISPAPENLLHRDFHAEKPNQKWLTDITEFALPTGKVYLSPVIDCFDGLVVSWSIGTRPDANLVNSMLDAAMEIVTHSTDRPIIHSDRGAHYRWPGWLSRIQSGKFLRSMSRKGCSPDNAACEGFFGRLKTEWFYRRDWRNTSIEQFIPMLDAYVRWYNEKRIKLSLGSLSPLEYRQSLGIIS